MSDIKPNKEQQKCIDNYDGKFLVLAGPGTGKTFTVINRIKNMIEHGVDPEKILCLSFSEAAAGEMKKGMAKLFNQIESGVNIYTYHSFCNEIISDNPEEFELPPNYRVIPETVKKQFLIECIEEIEPVAYRNEKHNPYVFLDTISKQITQIKRYRLTKEEYFKNIETNPDWRPQINALKKLNSELDPSKPKEAKSIVSNNNKIEKLEEKIAKATEAWKFYELYKAKMEMEGYVDFEDMIGFVLDKFETSPAFLEKIADKYEYLIVDEYQDTNKSQNLIVFYLVEALKSQNIFVVGDDDQIIYSFQGANLDTIENFIRKFPDITDIVCLKENMRSAKNILKVARGVITQDKRRLEENEEFKKYGIDKNIISANKELEKYNDRKVRLTKYHNIDQEFSDIVTEIDKLIHSDECPTADGEKKLSEIAIIAKSNEDLEKFAQRLKDRNIPYELKDGKNIFYIKSSIVLYYYLQALVNPELYADKLYKLLLMPPFNIAPEDYEILYEKASQNKSFIDTMRQDLKWKKPDMIKNFITTFDHLQKIKAGETVVNIIMEVAAKTGIFDYYLNEEINRDENIAGLKKIIDVAKEFTQTHKQITLEQFVDFLLMSEKDTEHGILTDKAPITLNAVQLTTYHSAKGKEFAYVYMPTLLKSKWEGMRGTLAPSVPVGKEDYRSKEEWGIYRKSDLIKTMYVGITRAKHTLRLSYPMVYGKNTPQPSDWIMNATNNDAVEIVDKSDYTIEDHLTQEINSLFKRPYDYKRDFKNMINGIVKEKYYSPTSVNNYLKCPRMYLYGDLLNFSPKADIPDAMNYGTAVHNSCEYFVNEALKNNVYPSKEDFLKCFRKEISSTSFSTKPVKKMYEDRGIKELSKFYHHLTDVPISSLVKAEHKIKNVFDGLRFVGKIDRIDKSEDGTYIISDYKTGSVQTEKNICMGGEHEDYYYQICLYKYFFEKDSGKKVSAVQFLFPIDGEQVLRFYPTDEECREVVENFTKATKCIENGEFEPNKSEKNCKYCAFKSFCEMDII